MGGENEKEMAEGAINNNNDNNNNNINNNMILMTSKMTMMTMMLLRLKMMMTIIINERRSHQTAATAAVEQHRRYLLPAPFESAQSWTNRTGNKCGKCRKYSKDYTGPSTLSSTIQHSSSSPAVKQRPAWPGRVQHSLARRKDWRRNPHKNTLHGGHFAGQPHA